MLEQIIMEHRFQGHTLRAIVASIKWIADTSARIEIVDSPLRARRQATLDARVTLGTRRATPARAAHAAATHARTVPAACWVQAILYGSYIISQLFKKGGRIHKKSDA